MIEPIDGQFSDLQFEVQTPLGFWVRTSQEYWQVLLTKHPDLEENLEFVLEALQNPVEVRLSQRDSNIFLFYALIRQKRWVVAVTRRLNGAGFLITSYQTSAIKQGEKIWPR